MCGRGGERQQSCLRTAECKVLRQSVKKHRHIEQACGFSPVWVRSCGATLLLLATRRGHVEQAQAAQWPVGWSAAAWSAAR